MRKLALLAAASLGLASPAAAATITVTSTADSGPGTLHQALLDSNASVGVLDTIAFAIPGAGVHTIIVSTDLPTATDPVIIDGTTQPGYAGSPLIELTESTPTQGLRISAGGSTVRGLAIFDFGTQLTLVSNGGNTVEACYIGTNATATATFSGQGLQIQNSPDTTVAGNVISGLTANGIQVVTSDRTIIREQPDRFRSDRNGGTGQRRGHLDRGFRRRRHRGDRDGRGEPRLGIQRQRDLRHRLGEHADRGQPHRHRPHGHARPCPTTSGWRSTTSRARSRSAAPLRRPATSSPVTAPVFASTAQPTAPRSRTTISAPTSRARCLSPTASPSWSTSRPRPTSSSAARIPGEGNVIVSNQAGSNPAHGILTYGQRVTVRGNRIHDNQGLGFDIDPIGVNPNDPGDADGGANDGQNFPIVTSVEVLSVGEGIGTRVLGVLRSESSTQYTLDFYGNDGCTPRPQDFLEAQTYLGAGQVTTDGTGFTAFDITVPVAIAAGDFVSATATDPDGNTSEFSQRLPFSMLPVSGDAAGGAPITIQGTDFAAGATVTIGGQPVGNLNIASPTQITATTPALSPGTVNDLTVTNTDTTTGTLLKAWVADFLDVPGFHNFNQFVVTLVRNGITIGIGARTVRRRPADAAPADGGVPPEGQVRRLLRAAALHGHVFDDVPCPSIFADWIEDLADQGITGGCGAGVYCPQNPVRRDQMAVFLLKTKYGSSYVPPPCDGDFDDVACPSQFADWIEQLAEETDHGRLRRTATTARSTPTLAVRWRCSSTKTVQPPVSRRLSEDRSRS